MLEYSLACVAASSPTVEPARIIHTYRTSSALNRPLRKSAATATSPKARKAITVGTTGKAMARSPEESCLCRASRVPCAADIEGKEAAEIDMPKSEMGSV